MCSIDEHENQQPSYGDDGSIDGDNTLQSNATTESLVSLITTYDFNDFWLTCFDHNYLKHSNMYIETTKGLFENPNSTSWTTKYEKKFEPSLHDIGVELYIGKLMRRFHPYRNKKLGKKEQWW